MKKEGCCKEEKKSSCGCGGNHQHKNGKDHGKDDCCQGKKECNCHEEKGV